MISDREWIRDLPKVELHVHLEGTVRPAKSLEIARRNGVDFPYTTVDEMVAGQDYGTPALQNFLAYHYAVFSAIRSDQDVLEIATAFFDRCAENNTRHVEVHVCLQDYVENGIELDSLLNALSESRSYARKLGVDAQFIYGINRGLSVASALDVLEAVDRHPGVIVGVGSCSEETGHPPIMFAEVFSAARRKGLRLTAHCDCDQENSVEHIRQCIQEIGVERIDHGIHILDGPRELLAEARARGIHFTVVPTWRPSDTEPRRIADLLAMHDAGLSVSVNTDDPEEFASGHLNSLLIGLLADGRVTRRHLVAMMRSAAAASWATDSVKESILTQLDSIPIHESEVPGEFTSV